MPAMSNLAGKFHHFEASSAAEQPTDAHIPGQVIADVIYPTLVRHLTGLLILALCLWMLAGIIHLVADLRETLIANWASIAEHVIIKALIMLALL